MLGKSTAALQKGTLIDYRLRLRGIPVRWQSLIAEWEPGRSFVDTQTRGPYRFWQHTHRFEPCLGGTLVVDEILYRVPGGFLGGLLGGRFVKRDLARIFGYRRAVIGRQFGGYRIIDA